MTAAAAKVEQATAKRLFTMARNQLSKSIDDGLSIDIVQKRFAVLQTRMNEIMPHIWHSTIQTGLNLQQKKLRGFKRLMMSSLNPKSPATNV